MTNNLTNKKQILKDPLTQYIALHPTANNNKLNELEDITKGYISLKLSLKEHKLLCQQTSKKIGIEKKSNKPIDDLLVIMKEQSVKVKLVSSQIKTLEDNILAFFMAENQPNENNKSENSDASNRTYKLTDINTKEITVSIINTEDSQDWNIYIDRNKNASIYHKLSWMRLINDTFGHQSFNFIAKDKNNITVGVLPLIQLKSRLFGNFMVSLPYFNYGGALADHPLIEKKLIEKAYQTGKELNISHIEFRDDIRRDELPVKTDKVNMILKLPSDEEILWDSFTPKLRAQIKRPLKENTETVNGGLEYLDEFYRVFSRNMRDLGTPVYSKLFFKNILTTFPENTNIIIVRLNNQPVAAAFLIGYKNRLEIPWASSIKSVKHLSINMLLYWEVLCFAIHKKYNFFDFGRSSKEANTYKFKKQWGAKPKQLYWHYWLNGDNEMPSLNPSNPKYALVIKVWKMLPIPLTKLIGPFIVKNLP